MNIDENIDYSKLNGFSFSREFITWILRNIRPGSTILELGSGIGSSELGKVYDMYCIENDPEYVGKYPNIKYLNAPLKDYGGYRWYDLDQVELPKSYAAIIIDGPLGMIGRMPFVDHKERFKLDVPILVDDTSREDERALMIELRTKLGRCSQEYFFGVKGFSVITTQQLS